jgi:hypothetical protein
VGKHNRLAFGVQPPVALDKSHFQAGKAHCSLFLCSEAGVGLPPRRKYSRSSVVMTSAEPLATQVQYTTMFSRGNPAFSAAARCVLKQS